MFVFVVSKGCFLLEGDLLALLLDGPYGGEKKLENRRRAAAASAV